MLGRDDIGAHVRNSPQLQIGLDFEHVLQQTREKLLGIFLLRHQARDVGDFVQKRAQFEHLVGAHEELPEHRMGQIL